MHYSVLLQESILGLNLKPDGLYIDGTFGRGGHTKEILKHLSNEGTLISFDRDPDAIKFGSISFKNEDNLTLVHNNFSTIYQYCLNNDLVGKVDGVLLDLGVSSPQLDEASRGFSFMHDGPLDMRMNPHSGNPVSEIIKELTREELTHIFKRYGEEKYAWSIAGAIRNALDNGETIDTTLKLANIIEKQVSRKEKKHPATRCFQALRIYVNEELLELEKALNSLKLVLKVGARVSIISFHSLEDKIVKQFITKEVRGTTEELPRGLPLPLDIIPNFKWVTKKLKASTNEIDENVRSRSAILRVAERI
jgi:16S rRNA (cytosine1402-N4)-methyltransferase